ncbi:hypothetical protein U1Q18_010848 [Sarracenia purpurea var. burkii]
MWCWVIVLRLAATALLYSWSWASSCCGGTCSQAGGNSRGAMHTPCVVVSLAGYRCPVPCCMEVRDSSGARGANNRGCRLSPNSALGL